MGIHDALDRVFNREDWLSSEEPPVDERPHGDYFVAERYGESQRSRDTFQTVVDYLNSQPVKNEVYELQSDNEDDYSIEVFARSRDKVEIYGWDEELTRFFDVDNLPPTMFEDEYGKGIDGHPSKKERNSQNSP